MAENLNYGAAALTEYFKDYFNDLEDTKQYAFDPEAVANHVSFDRLGNKEEVDEEYLFRRSV